MKTYKKFMVLMVASLLMSTNIWANGQVTVIKKLNGNVNSSAGTVTYSVAQTNNQCTLTVKPADGNYATVSEISAELTIDAGHAQAPRRAPGITDPIEISATDATADPSGETTYYFQMPENEVYDVEVTVNFLSRTSISSGTLTLAQSAYDYTGLECKPGVTVTLNGSTLANTNYTVAYTNNIAAGTATVTVTGARTYNGTLTKNFTINKAALSDLQVLIEGWTYDEYDAEVNAPRVSGNLGQGEVTYTYKAANQQAYTAEVPVNAGNYTVKASVAETDNYTAGEATADFVINKAELSEDITVNITGWTYGDDANTPSVTGAPADATVTYSYITFDDGEELESATAPVNAGFYLIKASISESANYLAGEFENEFEIEKASLALVDIQPIDDYDFTGEAIEPEVVVTFKGQVVDPEEYSVDYENNIEIGVATVKLTSNEINFSTPEVLPTQTFNIIGTEVDMKGLEWITYYADQNLVIPEGLKAYVVTNVSERTVNVSPVEYIPEGVAVLIEMVEPLDRYAATPYRGAAREYESLLQGCAEATSVVMLSEEDDIYVLYNGEFVKTTSGTIAAGRCYLPVSKDMDAESRLSIVEDGNVTGIDNVNRETITNNCYYDLQGRKINQPAKGLYILNGKKLVIK